MARQATARRVAKINAAQAKNKPSGPAEARADRIEDRAYRTMHKPAPAGSKPAGHVVKAKPAKSPHAAIERQSAKAWSDYKAGGTHVAKRKPKGS